MRVPPVRRIVQALLPLGVAAVLFVPRFTDGPRPADAGTGAPLGSFQPTTGTVPRLAGPALSGGAFDTASLRGHIAVLNFWNPFCPPCRVEQPTLTAAWETLRGRGVAFVGVMYVGGNWPDDRAAARSYIQRYGVTYRTLVDGGSRLARAVGVVGIPSTIVVDRTGHLRYRLLGGARPGQIERVVALVEAAG